VSQIGRQRTIEIFQRALAESSIQHAVEGAVRMESWTLVVQNQRIPLAAFSRIFLVALGKGAAPFFDAVGSLLPKEISSRAVVSAPTPPKFLADADLYFCGGHPEPNADTLRVAQAALDLLATADASTLVIFLITGGASAMFDLPISPTITLDDLIQFNRLLVASGAPIGEINCVRKHLSAVKGGRLAAAAADATYISLLISDVPKNQLDSLASGPTLADTSTVNECLTILERYNLRARLPESIQKLIAAGLPETPKQIAAKYQPAVLLSNESLVEHAAHHAISHGYDVTIDNTCDDWEYQAAAKYLLQRIRTLPRDGKPLCLLSGGELAVTLPRDSNTGIGGRNQQFALECALQMQASENDVTVLSAGSDGVDGNSPAAGAVADNSTVARAAALGLNAQTHCEVFDAYPLFHSIGDDILTGPTGNNLRDLRILLRD
jgi:hydroxypyruvate reductase